MERVAGVSNVQFLFGTVLISTGFVEGFEERLLSALRAKHTERRHGGLVDQPGSRGAVRMVVVRHGICSVTSVRR
jgi:hypothetical protein